MEPTRRHIVSKLADRDGWLSACPLPGRGAQETICQERGVRMPGFFGYMVWSCPILLLLFALVTMIFFRF